MAAREPARPLDLADNEGRHDAGQHEHGEEVDENRIPALLPKPWQGRVLVDDADHRDEDGGKQDDEAPKDRGMHQARQEPLQQFALADDDDGFGASPAGQVVESLYGLAHPHEAVEQHGAAPEQGAGDDESRRQDDGGYGVHRCLRSSAEIAGTISLRSPTTA